MKSKSKSKTLIVSALAAYISALLSTASYAGAFSVTPVRLFFGPKDRAIAVTLINEGDSEIALQADVNSWTQNAAGADQLTLTEDLIVAPPMMKLAPHAKQVVRLALLTPRDMGREITYRLIVREVPEASGTKDAAVQLPIALVLSMPVFITAPAAQRTINCVAASATAQAVEVSCVNSGTAYAQVRDIQLKRGGQIIARFEGSMYVLPGATKALTINAAAGQSVTAGDAELTVQFDDSKAQTFNVRVR